MSTTSVLMLPYTASSVGVARRQLTGELARAGVYEAIACDASLVLSELVSNALRHGSALSGNLVRVAWELGDDCVEIMVSDAGGATVPVINRPAANALGGRGLGIVERLALRWGVFSRQDGYETTVWAALPLLGSEPGDAADSGPQGVTAAPGAPESDPGSDSGQDLVIASSRDA